MGQDLRLLDGWVRESDWPHVACPTCGDGFLEMESLNKAQSADSVHSREDEIWEPEWIFGTFHGVLRCARSQCGEAVSVAGEYGVRSVPKEEMRGQQDYDDYYRLRFALPALTILDAPDNTPDEVKAAISAAEEVLWVDPSSAANRLRLAIETLLTELGQRRFHVTKPKAGAKGKQQRLPTHARITEYQARNPDVGDALLAVKWIGNSGSHDSELTVSQVLDGADMLNFALRLLYDKTDKNLKQQISAVNKQRGLPKKRAVKKNRP